MMETVRCVTKRLCYTTRHQNACRFYCQKSDSKYSQTVLLPKTQFPQRCEGKACSEREISILQLSNFADIYEWQRQQEREKSFVLHDGPPYANGQPHIGHAVNKILKDITNRYMLLRGYKVHYVPGWDCHGLPIEMKALVGNEEQDKLMTTNKPLIVREKARRFATKFAKIQLEAFKRWGVMANWNDVYMTYNNDYIASQLKLFGDLHEKGYIFRDFKPVFWSYSTRTALAEAELEYDNNHKSTAIYFKCKIKRLANIIGDNIHALVWTTTPWTVPCNQAICYSPDYRYCVVSVENSTDQLLIACERIKQLEQILSTRFTVINEFDGGILKGAIYCHPLNGTELQFLSAQHVVMDKGTGLVHSAPAHGPDDFLVALDHKLPVKCMVDEDAKYVPELGEELAGKFVLDEGNETVLKLLGDKVLHLEPFCHSYPYDWRSKKPVIIRASLQWFIDTNKIKQSALNALEDVRVFPNTARTMLVTQLEKRPYWCISRQRFWGVPIPVFYESETKTCVINSHIINHLITLLHKHGNDFWWQLSDDVLLPNTIKQQCGLDVDKYYERGSDILDIWFDSGSSWTSVLKEHDGIADVLIEGKDQIGGWFQSTLLTSSALRGKAPYNLLYIHGFAMDEEGKKMSKSLGNVVNPAIIVDGGKDKGKNPPYGADVLRWWVALHASGPDNVPIGPKILKSSTESIHKIRIVLRFLMGILHNFNPNSNSVTLEKLLPLDRYMLHLLLNYRRRIIHAYDSFYYAAVGRITLNFVTNQVSAFYLHLIKDRIYCEDVASLSRCSALTVASHVLQTLLHSLAPILPFLAEEVSLHISQVSKPKTSVFHTIWGEENNLWESLALAHNIENVLKIRRSLNQEATLKSLHLNNYDLEIAASTEVLSCLQVLQSIPTSSQSPLCELFQVATVTFIKEFPEALPSNSFVIKGTLADGEMNKAGVETTVDDESFSLLVRPSAKHVCPRCRRRTAQKQDDLCERCQNVLTTSTVNK